MLHNYVTQAPVGCKVTLTFTSLDVGAPPTGSGSWACPEDYVGVSRTGDKTFAHPASRNYCGSTVPSKIIKSKANKLFVIFNGMKGSQGGFKANYQVIC